MLLSHARTLKSRSAPATERNLAEIVALLDDKSLTRNWPTTHVSAAPVSLGDSAPIFERGTGSP